MQKSDKHDLINKAIFAVQSEIPVVEKTATNGFYNNAKYAPYDEIKKTIGHILVKHGLIVEHSPIIEQKEIEAVLTVKETVQLVSMAMVTVTTKITHVESDQWKEQSMTFPCEKNSSHGLQAVISYIKRNNIILMLDIAVGGEDDDGNAGVTEPEYDQRPRGGQSPRPKSTDQGNKKPAPEKTPEKTNQKQAENKSDNTSTEHPPLFNEDGSVIQDDAPYNQPQGPNNPTPTGDGTTTQANGRGLTNAERSRLNLIDGGQFDALTAALKKSLITGAEWKPWLKASYGVDSAQHITKDMYQSIYDTVSKHSEIIKNFKNGGN